MKTRIASALAIVLIGLSASAQVFSTQIDAIFAPLKSSNAPGAAVLVVRNGKAVYRQGYGVTDLRTLHPIDPQTDFRLASFTKQFTAACIMLLVKDGKLHYDDHLTDVFPEFPAYGKSITIRNLLNHTSGLPDYEDILMKQYPDTPPEKVPQILDTGVLKLLEQQTKTEFPAGTKWEYSNSGYAVLAMIVEKVSGKPFGAVSAPADLRSSEDGPYPRLRERQERGAEPCLWAHEDRRWLAGDRSESDVSGAGRRRHLYLDR